MFFGFLNGLKVKLNYYTEYGEIKYCRKVDGQEQGKENLKVGKKCAIMSKLTNKMRDVSTGSWGM